MAIDIPIDYEIGNKVNDDPVLVVAEDFVSNEEASHLIMAARPQLERAFVSDGSSGVISAGRTGGNCWVNHQFDGVVAGMTDRISKLVGIPLENAESLQVIHYGATQEYAPHYDAWDADTERGIRCMARGGNRLVTCLIYLNDVLEGGGTCFPELDMEVRAIKGRMVIFHNCHIGTNLRHPASLHGGMPVLAGEKWACNLWFRESKFQRSDQPTAAEQSNFSRVI